MHINKAMQHHYRAKLIRCVDGDTFDAEVDLGFNTFARIRFRLLDIDTPERGQPGFHEATRELNQLIRAVQSDNDGWFVIESHKTGKYGRWLARLPGVSIPLAAWLKNQGW